MTPQDLIAAFDEVAEAPNGVERLRELVLELAVRGKLVPQDPAEDPASMLLERIVAAEAGLVRAGKGPKRPALEAIVTDEQPFEIPGTWAWARLNQLTHDLGQTVPDRPFSYIDVGSIDSVHGTVAGDPVIIEAGDAPSRARKLVKSGTVIYSTVRPYLLNIAMIERKYWPMPIASTAFAVLHPCEGIEGRLLLRWLRSPFFTRYVVNQMKGVAYPAINDASLLRAPVPVPPAGEQRRIVTRVDELMGLLDQLGGARSSRDAARAAVRDSAFAALQRADAPGEVEIAWNRVAEHLDDLLYDPADIGPGRQTVLQLAVRGLLVPQDPADEPASELLERIAADRAAVVAAKLTRMGDDPGGYDERDPLPVGWEWAPLQDVVQFVDYRGKTPPKTANGVRLITAKNIRDSYITEEPREFVSPKTYERWMTRGFPKKGDVLFTTEAPMGKAALVAFSERFALAQRVINLHPYADLDSKYLMWMLLSPWFRERLRKRATGMTATGIKGAKLRLIRVPIPPVHEQRRIGARVDELIGLLDRLEARLTAARTAHGAFAAAAVHHLDA